MTDASSIYVIANIDGQLERAFKQLSNLHAKHSFSFAIVVGNLFAENEDDEAIAALLGEKISVPVDTYFTIGTRPLPPRIVDRIVQDEEICANLHYLGKRSVTKTVDGVRIITLGGVLDPQIVGGQSKEQHLPFHTVGDAKALLGAGTADILLTSLWPANVWKNSRVSIPVDLSSIPSSGAIAELCSTLKPRYHFTISPSDFAYEREPFSYLSPDSPEPGAVNDFTRFISLAPFRNAAKAKASYAFHLQRGGGGAVPADLTLSPFSTPTNSRKRRHDDANGYQRFSTDDHGPRRDRHPKRRIAGPDECFFCVARPEFTTYMVAALGDEAYLATAKGPLPSSTTFKQQGLDFPAHMIIAPYEHVPTVSRAALANKADGVFKEMTRFREALQGMVSSRSKHKLGAVTWEINRGGNIHAHWQFLPTPADLVLKGLVEAAFRVEAENQGMPKLEVRDFDLADAVEGSFLRVWIWAEEEEKDDSERSDGGKIFSKSLVMRFDEAERRFDLQFARRVMAKLLRLEKRIIWRDLAQSQEEEMADAEAFKAAFKEWDFTGTIAAA